MRYKFESHHHIDHIQNPELFRGSGGEEKSANEGPLRQEKNKVLGS